jgi:ABC-type polysaccharide/polyol phosphate export permease
MRALLVLTRIRLAEVLRKKGSAFWFFALPLILVGLVALVFQKGHPFERRHVVVVGSEPAALEREVGADALRIDRVDDEAAARARLRSRSASAIVLRDELGKLRVVVGRREMIFGRGLVAELGGTGALEVIDMPETGYVTYLVPGMLAQSVIIAGLFGMGYQMVRFRQSRFLRKLATTPLSRTTFVLSNILSRLVLVGIQLAMLLVVVRIAFDVPLTPVSFAWVLLTGAFGLVAFMGIGFVISCAVTSEDVVTDIINAVAVPIALLSEIFFPSEELPRALALLSAALPSTQMVRVMRAVLLHGESGSTNVLVGLAILAAWALVTFTVAVRAFKWR